MHSFPQRSGRSQASYQRVPTTEAALQNTSAPLASVSSVSSQARPSQEDIKQRMAFSHRSDSDQRAALTSGFSRKQPASGSALGIGKPSVSDRHSAQMTSDLEAQNDELIDELHSKVLGLKEVGRDPLSKISVTSVSLRLH